MSRTIDRRRFIKELSAGAMASLIPGVAVARRRGGLRLMGPPKNIVVLGAGLAGLSAAFELEKAGHSVTILEARKAPGGRVRTLRNEFDDGLYAEAGPVSFPMDHEFTFGYASDFGLPLRGSFKFGLDQIAKIHGNVFRIGSPDIPLDLAPREKGVGVFGQFALYMRGFMRDVGNPRKSGWPPESLTELDSVSCGQMLRDLGATEAAVALIDAAQLGLLGFGLDSLSAMDAVVAEALSSNSAFFEIFGGNDQLPQAFRDRLRGSYRKKSIVQRISQNDDGVTVTFSRKGNIQSITADRVVCALPFPVLKDIEIDPPFSDEKRHAIDELKLTPVTRTYLQFRSRVWEQQRLDGFGFTDLSIQTTYSPTLVQGGRRGILASYTGGQRALDLGSMAEEDRQSTVLRKMGDLFGGLRSEYEMGTSYIWHEDPFAKGAYAYFQPGQMVSLLPAAQQPEGRIHFAGEHTSAWHGWMNGALESGNRAAAEVVEAEATPAIAIRSR